jgi:thiamine biosynthesis lipoprotein
VAWCVCSARRCAWAAAFVGTPPLHRKPDDARSEATHHCGRAGQGAPSARQAHDVVRGGWNCRRRRARRAGCAHARRNFDDDEQRVEHDRDIVLGDGRDDDAIVVIVEQRVVVTFHRIREHRKLILSEYRQRRLMTLAAYRGSALGTSMDVVVTDPDTLAAATAAVEAVVGAIDLACSRFREDSELSRLQAGDGRREGTVSPLLAQALATALRAAQLTEGAVDPTVGEAVRSAGYSVDFDAVPADGAPLTLAVSPVPGWRRIRLFPVTRRVEIDAGVEIDLGATAKALAADLAAAAALDAMHGGGVLVSLGGDVSVAGDPPDEGWHIQIAEDSRAAITPDGETIAIRAGGLATSSTTVRRWRRGGVELHHIIDPATGLPASGPWRTVSVVAGSCVDANIAATAAIVRGATAAAWLDGVGLPARLVDRSGAMTRVGGWPAPSAQTS